MFMLSAQCWVRQDKRLSPSELAFVSPKVVLFVMAAWK